MVGWVVGVVSVVGVVGVVELAVEAIAAVGLEVGFDVDSDEVGVM
jgi:hypothetical protein